MKIFSTYIKHISFGPKEMEKNGRVFIMGTFLKLVTKVLHSG